MISIYHNESHVKSIRFRLLLDLSVFCIFYDRKKSEMVLRVTTFISMILSYHIWIIYNTKDSKFTEINVVILAISAKLSV